LVTEADLRSEELIRRAIEAEFPSHRVVSEESWNGWGDDMFAGPAWVVDLVAACRDVRRMGSPALDIAWVGAGFLDAHCESLAPWDVAAAAVIATEAGARRGNLEPEPFPIVGDLAGTGIVVAAPSIYPQLVDLLSEAPADS
jgi:fructose-1,6-bisphosphatase/inositol monophosphatase family enzyme